MLYWFVLTYVELFASSICIIYLRTSLHICDTIITHELLWNQCNSSRCHNIKGTYGTCYTPDVNPGLYDAATRRSCSTTLTILKHPKIYLETQFSTCLWCRGLFLVPFCQARGGGDGVIGSWSVAEARTGSAGGSGFVSIEAWSRRSQTHENWNRLRWNYIHSIPSHPIPFLPSHPNKTTGPMFRLREWPGTCCLPYRWLGLQRLLQQGLTLDQWMAWTFGLRTWVDY